MVLRFSPSARILFDMHHMLAYVLFASSLLNSTRSSELSNSITHQRTQSDWSAFATGSEVRTLLTKVGITPEAACASGLQATDLPAVFQAAADVCDASGTALRGCEQAVCAARATLDLLNKKADGAEGLLTTDVQQARIALALALQAQSAALDSAFQTVCAAAPESTRSTLAAYRANSGRAVPSSFKVIARSSSEWEVLEKATAHAAARRKAGLLPTASSQVIFDNAASDASVLAAKSRLELTLGTIQGAWATLGE
ncbi:MAG: hypothetical protein QM783_05080 [Phycisphaerales bacterium]